jgi:CDGSH-type Zn-finger protein
MARETRAEDEPTNAYERWLAVHPSLTLCRCGQSKNKPFCDGSHWHANFVDDNN